MKSKLVVNVNEHGIPLGIHLSTAAFKCSFDNALEQMEIPDLAMKFDTQKPQIGSSPETAKYLKRLEKQREEMARAEQNDNRSFFAKYWTYIVPVVFVLLVFSNFQDPNAGGGNAPAASGSGGGNR